MSDMLQNSPETDFESITFSGNTRTLIKKEEGRRGGKGEGEGRLRHGCRRGVDALCSKVAVTSHYSYLYALPREFS